EVICHGLIRCSHQAHIVNMADGSSQPHLWNRDLVIYLNMHYIICNFHSGRSVSQMFRRRAVSR
ncbi:hypothetical protein BX666DRAFT_1835003, partial [Dichotomocladium elegans]